MSNVKVKICGITRKEDLEAATTAGADAVGFVVGVASSPRNLSLAAAERLIRQVPPFVKSVLVTVPRSLDEFEAYEKLNPDAIQIHCENPYLVASVRLKLPNITLIGAVNARAPDALNSAVKMAKLFDAVLLDSFVGGKYGGTGVAHNWELSRQIRKAIYPKPLILAGGLTPENVADALHVVEPYAVDVSS
ncbi:MAG: phosphoribosylanthranilate isomerase, partial [Candidatus Bathyarchaeota archaeon]|nr:phosphoribosylanthranilate isomerase [Candidatus Bathyarchaeota archaeon]